MISNELSKIIGELMASEDNTGCDHDPDDEDSVALTVVSKDAIERLREHLRNLEHAQFVVVRANDWEGLYKDGVLKEEDHRIPLHRLLDELGVEYYIKWADDEWMEDMGNLPQNLSEVAFKSE